MTRNLKTGLFSAVLLMLISYPILGLKLSVVGIRLQVDGASAETLWIIGGAALAILLWHLLLRDRLLGSGLAKAALPSLPEGFKHSMTLPHVQRWIMFGLLVIALVWPFFGTRAAVDIATLMLIYIMLGVGLNIVVGLAGLLDLGYVGFYAVGAYTYAMLAEYAGFGFWTALPIAGLTAATFGFLLGFPVLRLRGDYLAIVTLGFGEIIRIMLRNLTEYTGGPNGISVANENKPTLFGISFERRVPDGVQTLHDLLGTSYNSMYKVIFLYLIALLLVVLALFVINRLMRMPIGRAWEALREDEIACRALGLNPTTVKLSAFTIGASFAGFAGCFFGARQGLVTPESFTFIESAMILAIVVLGGMGSQLGIIFAAAVMVMLQEIRDFNEYRMLIFGLTMILMMIWRPQGLIPMQRPHLELKP